MSDKLLREAQNIKALLIVLLLKLGASSEEIGPALGVHPSRVRQMVPVSKIRKIKAVGDT